MTTAADARGSVVAVAEVVIPILEQLRVLPFQSIDLAKLGPPEAAAATSRHKPELRHAVIPLDVDMRGLVAVARVEEQIRPNSEDGRHRWPRHRPMAMS